MVDSVVDYAIILLNVDGTVRSWNSGAEHIYGYKAHDIVGRDSSILYTKEDQDAGVPSQALNTARQAGRFETEGWRVRRDGRKFCCSVVIHPVLDDQGQLAGFAKITRDVTEQKRHREEQLAVREPPSLWATACGLVGDAPLMNRP